jgi:flagellar basal-body rod protein FlgB
MNDLAILRMADAMARHAATRHAVVAENVAHADTPGYRARDLPDFAELVREREALKATRPTHLNGAAVRTLEAREDAVPGAQAPNGNDVSLSDQLTRAAAALGAHDRATTIYAKTLDILRLGVGRR